jgi:hypothetical protein
MRKTGESYTTARAQVLKRSTATGAREERATPHVPGRRPRREIDPAELAGMSDEAVRAKTGRTWKEWVRELDSVGAISMSHGEIARRLHESYGISGWWSQMVTVGYERIRGLREIGQRLGSGTFDANKSKTFAVPVSRLYRAFAHKSTRERWLQGVELEIRTSTRDKSMRATWPDGTSVHVYFTAKGPHKSQVALQHVGLPDRNEVTSRKEYWAERLEALKGVL